ncbi:hypothetical protein F5878DRAFT_665916 [Lentinula raphanica]|uniref:Uncharacterized protein n=1 Tax=Lentinula raphanica TaxID=153919 RepID=A0AA38NYT2_9AGAR|nr:hypothetical protein F5878DRAFT_665916 [Lentinula raphanica]
MSLRTLLSQRKKLIKRRRLQAKSLEEPEEQGVESSEGEGMKLRPPSSTGRERISLLYNLGIEDSQVDTQLWTEGMRHLNEDNSTYLKPRRPSPSEDVHFSQRPPGWFGSDEPELDEDDTALAADGQDGVSENQSKETVQLMAEIRTLQDENKKLQARVNDTSQELKEILDKNTQLTCSLKQSRKHSSALMSQIAVLKSKNDSLHLETSKQQVKLRAITGIIARTGDIFVEFGSGSFDSEKLHHEMNGVLLSHLESSQS